MTQSARVIDSKHNQPPSDLEIVAERLLDEEKELRSQMKFMAVPPVIADEKEAGHVTDAIKGVKNIISQVSDIHKTVKKPYLECGKSIDAWKNRLENELEEIGKSFAKPLNSFLDKRAAEERIRQIEAAKAERERAEALALEAQAHAEAGIDDTAEELLDEAVSSEIMASRMEDKVYTATPSQLVKARSVHGVSASQRLVWVGVIQNVTAIDFNQLGKFLAEDALQKAVDAFVRDGGRKLDGVLIHQITKLNVR